MAAFPSRRAPVATDDDMAPPSDFESSDLPNMHPAGPGAGVTPESVKYHEQAQRCDLCQNLGQDNQCSVLKQEVSPEGGCDAFTPGSQPQGGDDDDMDDDTEDDDFDDSDEESYSPLDGPRRGGYGS